MPRIHSIFMLILLLLLAGCAAPILKAVDNGRINEVESILDAGADVNAIYPHRFAGNWTPLLVATWENNTRMVKLLLKRGADPNAHSGKLWAPPLLSASAHGNLEMVRILLDAGADPTVRVSKGGINIQHVKQMGGNHLKAIELLEEAERKFKVRKEREAQLRSKLPEILAAERAGDEAMREGNRKAAFKRYLAALELTPPGTDTDLRLRKKTISFVRSMRPKPPFPAEAKRHAIRGQTFLKIAKNKEGYQKALTEFQKAVQLAPWWASGYFNLALVQEKVEDFDGAMGNLKLYLIANPGARDAAEVEKKIIELEVLGEVKGK